MYNKIANLITGLFEEIAFVRLCNMDTSYFVIWQKQSLQIESWDKREWLLHLYAIRGTGLNVIYRELGWVMMEATGK